MEALFLVDILSLVLVIFNNPGSNLKAVHVFFIINEY